jgi:hypothetical protein
VEVQFYLFLTSAVNVSDQVHTPAASTQEETHPLGACVDPRDCVDVSEKFMQFRLNLFRILPTLPLIFSAVLTCYCSEQKILHDLTTGGTLKVVCSVHNKNIYNEN